jgi:hypothetical protein
MDLRGASLRMTPFGGLKNISRRGPRNRRSLGYARDDKGDGHASMEGGCLLGAEVGGLVDELDSDDQQPEGQGEA